MLGEGRQSNDTRQTTEWWTSSIGNAMSAAKMEAGFDSPALCL